MKIYLNCWGGEGYLVASSVLAMASMGMFDDLHDSNKPEETLELHYRCMDFATGSYDDKRQENLRNAYEKYRDLILGATTQSTLEYDNFNMDTICNMSSNNLKGKYNSEPMLAAGCDTEDMQQNIRKGIYGKPWIGEAYHADAAFKNMYPGAAGNIVIINAGGYKGGGTAATFIPLESAFDINSFFANNNVTCERYNIITGPSTVFPHTVKIEHPEIYGNEVDGIALNGDVDIFDIRAGKYGNYSKDVLGQLEAMDARMTGQNLENHNANKKKLEEEYRKIEDPQADKHYQSLDPRGYMGKYIDRLRSDPSFRYINAAFINMHPLLTIDNNGNFNYDLSAADFQPDNQMHWLHITNMLSAVTVQELVMNHSKYVGGGAAAPDQKPVYTFASPNGDKYLLNNVFRPVDAVKVHRFLAFSVLMITYCYGYFYDIERAGAPAMRAKWAKETKDGFFAGWSVHTSNKDEDGRMNRAFAEAVKQVIVDLAVEFIRPVLKVLMDVEKTSNLVAFFPAGSEIRKVVDGILDAVADVDNEANLSEEEQQKKLKQGIVPIESAEQIEERTNNALAAVVMGQTGYPADYNEALKQIKGTAEKPGSQFFTKYHESFAAFGSQDHGHRCWSAEIKSKEDATRAGTEYGKQIITNTYNKVKELLS